MGCGTEARDTVETAASLAANYELPGVSLAIDPLLSKGSQQQLSSPLGRVANVASGVVGGGFGSDITGIPESAGGALEGNILSGIGDAAKGALGATTDFLGLTDSGAAAASDAINGTAGTGISGAATVPSPAGVSTASAAPTAPVGASDLPALSESQIGSAGASSLEGTSTPAATNLGTLSTPATATSSASNLLPWKTGGLDAGEQALLGNANLSAATTNASAPGITAGTSAAKAASGLIPGLSNKDLLSAGLPVANLAYQAIRGTPPLTSQAQPLTNTGAVTGPLINTETQGVNSYNAGVLTAPQQAQVDQFVQSQTNQLIQQLANEGVTDFRNDSRYIAGTANIQQQAVAMKEQLLQQTFQNALSAAGSASGNLATVANQQVQNDQSFQNALTAATSAIGQVLGGKPNINIVSGAA